MKAMLTAATAALLVLASLPADAQSERRLYVGAFGGLNFLMEADVEVGGATVGSAEFDSGYAAGGIVGYRFLDDFRAELELSYRSNDIDTLFTAPARGDATNLAAMVNGYYDFPDIASRWSTTIRPYLGGGIGAAQVAWNDVAIGATPVTDDDEVIFAFQAGAGVGFGITDSITLSIDYRFFATPNVELSQDGGTGEFEVENRNHTATAGIRFAF